MSFKKPAPEVPGLPADAQDAVIKPVLPAAEVPDLPAVAQDAAIKPVLKS